MSERSSEKSAQPEAAPARDADARAERTGPEGATPVRALIAALGNRGFGRLVQAKLTVGQPGDRYEQEADRVADEVLATPGPAGVQVQRVPAGSDVGMQRQEDGEAPVLDPSREEGDEFLQAKEDAGPVTAGPQLEAGVDALRHGGEPLPGDVRGFFEPRLGRDLGGVRLHTGDRAGSVARDAGALAFTVGRDIVFAPGRFAPETAPGQRLLAHELVHVVQQGHAPEAAGVPAGPAVSPTATSLQRQPAPKSPAKLTDPIGPHELPGYDFYNIGGVEYSRLPVSEVDVRRVLVDNGLVDATTMGECTVALLQLKGDDRMYYAYTHPTRGVVARAYAGLGGKRPVGKTEETYYSVFAYISDADSSTYAYARAKAVPRDPSPLFDVMTGGAPATIADLQADLRLIEARLWAFSQRYQGIDAVLINAIINALGSVRSMRTSLVASPAQATAVANAIQLLEWVEYDFGLLDRQREKLVNSKAPVTSVDAVRKRYAELLENLFAPDAADRYAAAQRWAERLPIDILLDALRAHGEINKGLLIKSDEIIAWSNDLRKKVDELYEKRQQLAAKPGDATLTADVQSRSAFLEAALRGIQLFGEQLVAFENFLRNRPGVLDTPLVDAMNRLNERVEKIKAAYDAGDAKLLKERVDSLEKDPAVKTFYLALPGAMQVTQMIGRIGVATIAALATGGVGGLLAGGARTVATGLTLRGALTFAGTAVLEAATFTAINTTASAVVFGDKVTFGSVLKDFAWNVGLFTVLRGVSGVSTVTLRAAELEVLNTPVQVAVGAPLAYGWGVIRFRIENDRWPTKEELDRMTAESVILLAATTVGSKSVARWLEGRPRTNQLAILYKEYGWRFDALESLRTQLGERVKTAVEAEDKATKAGKPTDPAPLEQARKDSESLEKEFQKLLQEVVKDKRFVIDQLRQSLLELKQTGPSVAADLLATALKVPVEVGARRAGKSRGSYTYANGKTNALEDALTGSGYKVTKGSDAASGLRSLKAEKPGAPDLAFQERAAGGLDFEPGVFDIQRLMTEFSITSAGAQRMLWRILSENGVTRNQKGATKTTRDQLRKLAEADKSRPLNDVLSDLNKTGWLRSRTAKDVVDVADRLEKGNILSSSEWLEARTVDGQRGVVGEWLAREAVPPAAGAKVLRRVTVQAEIFEDSLGTVPAKDSSGKPLTNATAAETDLIYVRDVSGTYEVDSLVNVKASGEKGMAASARIQNENFASILSAKPGDLAQVKQSGGPVRYVRVKSITALDGGTAVDLTGKLKPATALARETVGPKGTTGFTQALPQEKGQITTVAALLAEKQLITSGDY